MTPTPDIRENPTDSEILDTPMGPNDAGADTIRDYLIRLLAQVWGAGEAFNRQRPFGNTGWEWELYAALAKAGHIHGTFDEDGYVEDMDTFAGRRLISSAIRGLAENGEDDDA